MLEKIAPLEKNNATTGGPTLPGKQMTDASLMLLEGDEEQETDGDEEDQESLHQTERKRVSSEQDEETSQDFASEQGGHQPQYEVVEIGQDDTDMNRVG